MNKRYSIHTFLVLLVLAFSASAFMACSDSKTEEVSLSPQDMFSVKTITFAGIAGEQTAVVEFDAPDAWVAEVHSISQWLQADQLHGQAGHARITLTPRSDNFGVTARQATLQIYIDGYEAYTIEVNQESASTGDIRVDGNISEGVMKLNANDTGTEFQDTIWVTSSRRWTLQADAQCSQILSFEHQEEPQNGVETTIPVVVRAAYSQFAGPVFDGRFYIHTEDGHGVTISVHAAATVNVYDAPRARQNEVERVSYQLVDTLQKGVFQTGFYVESNVRWVLADVPDWIETAQDWGTDAAVVTNVTSSGKVNSQRQHVTLRVNAAALGRDGKTGTVSLKDDRGQILKTIYLTFAGVGSEYLTYSLTLPAVDPYGNPWGFEATASAVNPDSPTDYWREISRPFSVTTSIPFNTLGDAPFHLLLVRADNGIARHEEVHWAHLEMGEGNSTSAGGLYTRQMRIRANDRGDEDDRRGITSPMQWRYAMMFLVPVQVGFEDLWTPDGRIRDAYAENFTLLAQKNNPDATYTFAFEGVQDGGTCTVPAEGGTLTLNVQKGSYNKCDVSVQQLSGDTWTAVGSNVCRIDFKTDENDNPVSVTFTLSANKGEKNPFTQQIVGSARHLRVSVSAFIDDQTENRVIYTFYIDQPLNE